MMIDSSSTENSTNLAIQIVIFLGVIINLIANWFREIRQRKWQIEDAEKLAKKTEETALDIKQSTAKKVGEVKEALDQQTKDITQAMRTRVSDLSQNFEKILNQERAKRRADD